MPDTLLTDPKAVLDPIPVDNAVKANAWDAFSQATSPDDFKAKFDKLALPDSAKADLWDMKFKGGIQSLSGLTAPKTTAIQDAETDPRMSGALVPQVPTTPIPPGLVPAPAPPHTRAEMEASAPGVPTPALPDGLKSDAQLQSEAPTLRNSRTGQPYKPALYGQSVLDFPYTAPQHILHGVEALAAPAQVGLQQVGERELRNAQLVSGKPLTPMTPTPPGFGEQVGRGVHELATGAFEAATPFMAGDLAAAPAKTLAYLAGAAITQKVAEEGAKASGLGPNAAAAVGDIGALGVGVGIRGYDELFNKLAAHNVRAGFRTEYDREMGLRNAFPVDIHGDYYTVEPVEGAAGPAPLHNLVDSRGNVVANGNSEHIAEVIAQLSSTPPTAQAPTQEPTQAPAPTPTAAPPQPPPSATETFLAQPRESIIPLTTDEGPAFLHPTLEADGDQHVVITGEDGEPIIQGPPPMVAQWMEQHAQRGAEASAPQKPQPVVNDAEYIRAHNGWNTARIKAISKYMQENPGATEAEAAQETQGTYGVEPQIGDYKAPPAPPEAPPAPVPAPEPEKPAKVGKVSPATPNAPTAATPTEPEAPATIAVQLQQVGRFGDPIVPGQPQRKVVMFPGGQGMPDLASLDGLAITNDGLGNTYAYRKDLISASDIRRAAHNNTLPEILGHAELGMGVPDKSAQTEEGVAVTAHAPDGTEVQTAVSPTDNIPAAIEAAQAVTPEGGHVSVKTPEQALGERQGLPSYLQEEIDRRFNFAQNLGVVPEVERLSAERKTALDIAQAIGRKKLGAYDLEDPTMPQNIVRAVRAKLGIPSMDDHAAFEAWLRSNPQPATPATTAEEPSHWLDSLTPEQKESVFAVMRDIRAEADRANDQHRALLPPHGQIAVGGAHMDPFFRAEALNGFLSALSRGASPVSAVEIGNTDANYAIEKFNKSRSNDYVVHRARDMEESHLGEMARRVERAVAGTTQVETPAVAHPLEDDFWSRIQRGDLGEGRGMYIQALLSAAKQIRETGGLQTRDQVSKFLRDYEDFKGSGTVESDVFKRGMSALIAKYTPAAPSEQTGTNALVNAIYQKLRNGESLGNITELNKLGEKYLGSVRASGNWTPKDLYDAMEAAVNRYLIDNGAHFLAEDGITGLAQLRRLMSRLTTQSIRTDEQLANQQFSSPPTLSYVVAKVANLHPNDVVLEPSAGNGGIAAWPKSIGATVFTNEISPRRREMLEAAGLGKASAHDGELINALLDRSIQPTVVLMNPPFSASTLKSNVARNNNTYGFNHVESALQRLVPGGRLVVILGGGQANEPEGGASFTGKKSGDWFRKIADRYNIRANIRINGKEYAKYGTSFATRLIVIDKDGPTAATPESRFGNAVRLNVDTLEQAYEALRTIAADRPTALRTSVGGGPISATPQGAVGGVESAYQPGDVTGVAGSDSSAGSSPTTGAGGTGITGIPPRSGQDSNGSELAGGSDAVPGPPERVQPETVGGSAPQQQSDVRPPRHNEPESTAGAGAVDQHANEQQPAGPSGLSNPELDSIVDDVAAGLEALLGKTPEPPAPPTTPKTPAPKRLATKTSSPPKAAPAPKVNPLDQAAIDAERDLRALLGDIPNMSVSDQAQRKAQIDRAILTKLGIIGGKHILDGAVQFDAWGDAMMKQVGDLIRALSQSSRLPAPEILRQVHMVASAAAKRFGVEAEATPPESEFYPTGDRLNLERQEPSLVHEEDTDAYVKYQPTVKGPQHPGDIVETKTMATVPLPVMSYRPALPQSVITNGTISNVQLEAIAMMGQQNDLVLPSGYRASALIGDGTGVGKGREAAGILWDNWRQGRRRLVWVSEKNDLMQDAARDFSGLGAAPDILANVTQATNGRWIFNPNSRMKTLASWNGNAEINHEGVIFATYALLRSENKKGGTRAEQLRKWLAGEDGGEGAYILFDESHNLKNAVPSIGSVGSKTGIRARQLLADIPGLRSASLSATAATEISNLGYLDRLGLWGPGTSFPGGFMDFQTAIGSGRMAAMELVARELKAQGKYISRTLSFKGVTQDTTTHELNEDQKAIYRTAARAWQQVFQSAQKTITDTNNGGKEAKSRFNSEFRSAQLRFFNVLLSTLKIPSAVKLAEESLAANKSVVITLVNTNEAAQNREKEKMSARKAQKVIDGDEENEEDEQEYDFGPKEMLVNLIEKNYPVQQWADDVDPNGKTIKVPVYTTDADGNRTPRNNPQAEDERDALIAEINRDLHMPGNPLDVLIEALGGRDKVAELTGRKERYDDVTGKFISRGDPGTARKDINIAEMKKFQNGDKRIAVLSSAAGTGISLHADKGAKNQQKRVQITLQVGWSADKQMQMFGRTHRTNQAHAPEYVMLVSDLGGEKRFIATIARRLGSLGALTKGQKNASAGADMMDKVNFETDQGRSAASAFYQALQRNVSVPGSSVGGLEVLRYLGVGREDEDSGEITISDAEKRNVTRLLNRLLALDPDIQNAFYEYYYDLFGANVRAAIEDGTLDTGVKSLPGDIIDVKQERLLATDPHTGAKTFYYPVDSQSKTERISPENLEKKLTFHKDENPRIIRNEKGTVALAINASPIVRANGSVDEAARVVTPGNATWRKVSLNELTRLKMQPVHEWAVERHHELEQAAEKADREEIWAQKRYDDDLAYRKERLSETAQAELTRAERALFKYQNGFEQAPLILSGDVWNYRSTLDRLQGATSAGYNRLQVTDNAENRKVLAGLRGVTLSGGNRLVGMSDAERLAQVPEAEAAVTEARKNLDASKAAPVAGDSWYAESLKTAQGAAAKAQAEVAAHAPIVKDPAAWAKEQWADQYDASPSHVTDEYHLIGGAVLKYWNAIREASPLLDIYTTVDSKTGQRIVGVSVMPQTVNQLIARISGGRATVTTGQMLRDVLINGTPFNLEGGIRVVRGRVARTPVIQFIVSNDAALKNLKGLGVITERGITPVHYLPTDGSKQSQILSEILKAYPVIQDEIGEAPAFSIEGPQGWSTPGETDSPPVLARYRDGVIYTTKEGVQAIGRLWGANLKAVQLPRASQNYAISRHLITNPRTDKLGLMIRAHANDPHGIIVVATGQGIGALKRLLRHERFHRAQQTLPLHLNVYEKAFMRHPLAQQASILLTKLGYPAERHSVEIGADLAAGEFPRLGLTRSEGRTLARVYFGALRAEHGDDAVDRIVDTGIIPAIAKEARERVGKQETTIRPTGPNTGGTGSNQSQYARWDSGVEGNEGGLRRLVRQDVPEGAGVADRLKLEPADTAVEAAGRSGNVLRSASQVNQDLKNIRPLEGETPAQMMGRGTALLKEYAAALGVDNRFNAQTNRDRIAAADAKLQKTLAAKELWEKQFYGRKDEASGLDHRVLASPEKLDRLGLSHPEGRVWNGKQWQETPEAKATRLDTAEKEAVARAKQLTSSVTLGSGFGALQPSLEKLYERDLKPAAKAVTKTVSGAIDDLKKVFAPDLRGPAAQKAAGLLRERGGERDQRRDRALALLAGMKKRFLQMPEQQGFRGLDVWNAVEAGQITGLSPLDLKFARAARSLLDQRWAELNKLGLLNTYIENYLPRSWKDPAAAENWVQSWQAKRPMAGREDFRKRRTYPTMQEGLDDPDFTLVPKFDNPVDMLMATLGQMDASITAHRVFNEAKQKGDLVYVPAGRKPPTGLVQIDDKLFKVAGPPRGAVTIDPGSRAPGGKQEPKPLRSDFGHGPGRWDLTPAERKEYQEALKDWRDENVQPEDVVVHGQRIMGHYYAAEPYARVINNDLSRGIDGSSFMTGVRSINNFMNAVQLSLSYYHGLTTTLNSSFSDMALGIEQALAGQPGKAATSIGRGLLPFASLVHDIFKGTKVLDAWDMQPEEFANLRQTDPQMWAIVDALKAAGAKARQDAHYQKQFVEALKDEWSRGNYGGAAVRAIPALAETLMKPIMEYMVPRVKLSAFAKLAAEELQNHPTYDRDDLRQRMGQIWNSIDNRFGQLVQRNLMMHALARGAMNAVVGRPGWNLGSVQEIAGGAKDAFGNINDLLHGRTTKVSHKTAYLLALLIGGAIINALTSFILTGGDAPTGWDYIAPRDGGVTEDGRPSRIILPTYLAKDLYSYVTRPRETLLAKTAPLISLTADLFRNRDFYDRKIYGDRGIGLLQYMRNELFPYSLTGLQKNRERHASPVKQVLPMIGIMPASKRVGLSPAERMIADFLDENDAKTRPPSGDRDKAKLDVFLTARTNERKAYADGQQYVKDGKLAPGDVTHALARAKQRPLVADYRHVTDFPTSMRIYDAATDAEKTLLKQDALHKANLAASRPWEWNDTGAANIAWKYFHIGPGPTGQHASAPAINYPAPF